MSAQNKISAPTMSYSKNNGNVRIRHREFISDISAAGAQFTVSSWPINPGIGLTFNWLQLIANSYEMYEINSLSFEFESSAITTDRGTLLVAIDFDASDSPPISKQDMMTYQGAVRSSVWSHCTCSASSKDLKKFGIQKFVRSASIPAGTDIKTYDVGTLYVATQGTGAITAGELYVSYDITFSIPQSSLRNVINGYAARLETVGATTAKPLGDSIVVTGGLGVKYRNISSFFINTLGSYLIEVRFEGGSFDATDSVVPTFVGGNMNSSPLAVTTLGTNAYLTLIVDVLQTGAYLQIIAADCTINQTEIRLAPYPYTLG